MRIRTPAVFGVAFFLSGIAGCALPWRASSDLQSEPQVTVVSRTSWLNARQQPSPTTPGSRLAGKQPAGHGDLNFSHPSVESFVTRFQTSLRGFFTRALSRSGRYVPRMSKILKREGLPEELVYLPLIESGFQPHAVSRAGAVGPWQLIPGTGRRYGLRIDRYVDERRDPVKSTQAAARYLKDLYAMFGDWHLSLAAYNTGEQNISRILERGRAEDFWEMSERGYLCRETRDFVPGFLAASQIATAPEAYGFDPPQEESPRYDVVAVKRPLPLSTIARLSRTSTDAIKELNPALQRGIVPPDGYAVRLPEGSKDVFEVACADLERAEFRAHREASKRVGRGHQGRVRRGVRHRHTVASGGKRHAGQQAVAAAEHVRPKTARARKALRAHQVARRYEAPLVVARHKEHSRILD